MTGRGGGGRGGGGGWGEEEGRGGELLGEIGKGRLVAGVTDRVGGWCDGVVAGGGVWGGRGGEERDGDDGVANGGQREEVARQQECHCSGSLFRRFLIF